MLTKIIEINLDEIENNWPENIPSGIIHADLFPDNIFFKGNKITEAAHSNVWIIKKKKIITHPANRKILKGITRTVLISLIKSLNLNLIEREFTIKELYNSDEVFITSSGSLITPIVQVDKFKINNCKIGSITKSLAINFYKTII